jgi:hypothetical protein
MFLFKNFIHQNLVENYSVIWKKVLWKIEKNISFVGLNEMQHWNWRRKLKSKNPSLVMHNYVFWNRLKSYFYLIIVWNSEILTLKNLTLFGHNMRSWFIFFSVWLPSLKCLTCEPVKINITCCLRFPRFLRILLLQSSKTNNNALDIDAIYNLKLRKV